MLRIRSKFKLFILFTILTTTSLFGQVNNYNVFEEDYHWLEILDIGQPVNNFHDNEVAGPFAIGYEFPFFDEIYEEFWISSNGFIGFGPAQNYASFNNTELPDRDTPNNIIALFWGDLNPEAFWAEGMIYTGIRDNKRIIQFEGIAERNDEGHDPENTITMQVILDHDGSIFLQYKEIGENFNIENGTIGVEDLSGNRGFTALFNGNDEGIEIANESSFMISDHGPGNFLVWDAATETGSGQAQVEALRELGHTVAYLQLRLGEGHQLPEELIDFEAVFVNLGNYGVDGRHYHVLTEAEGVILANYLEEGGSIYLEGSDTWFRDDATEVHRFFNIQGNDDGRSLEAPVTGLEGTFAENFVFEEYEADHNDFVDQLEVVNGSEGIFSFMTNEEEFLGMIAFWGETYRTIGCSFEFGGLVDGEQALKVELMERMIEFFRAAPPEFPRPLNLSAVVGDMEVTLIWDSPRRGEALMSMEILEINREINRLSSPKNQLKPDQNQRDRILELKSELSDLVENEEEPPMRDELDGFNVYVDGEEYDFTNALNYTVFDLENNQSYDFAVTAVYTDPNGESEPAGPISATPTSVIGDDWEEGFEEFNGALNPVPADEGWEWGVPEIGAANGERAWGTILNGPYPDNAEFFLNLPIIDLEDAEGVTWMSFNHFIDSEDGWDGGVLQLSLNDGDIWETVEPMGGYNSDHVFSLNDGPGFSGTLEDWENVKIDLSPHNGEILRFRLAFLSDFSNFRDYIGWYVDDFSIFHPALGDIEVNVFDGNDEEIEGATVEVVNFGTIETNRDGIAFFENVPVGEYTVVTSKPRYLTDTAEGVPVNEGECTNIEAILELWDSRILPDPDPIVADLAPDENSVTDLTLTNNGRDPTSFSVYIDYTVDGGRNDVNPGEEIQRDAPSRDEPWDLIDIINLTEETDEEFFIGANFVNLGNNPTEYQFVASAGDFNSGECRIYRFDREGNYAADDFSGLGFLFDGWGLRDLAYDGESLYGSQSDRIYPINPANGARGGAFDGARLEVNRAITYIEEDEAFWVGNWDDSWFKIDFDENILDQNTLHGLTGVTGMAWNPSDPDGAFLYIHNQENQNGGAAVYRYNPETRELIRQLVTAEEEEGFAGGLFVTSLYDTQHWVLGALIQGPEGDVIKLYELWPIGGWLSVDPDEGELEANGGDQVLNLTFDATGLFATQRTAMLVVKDEMSFDVIQIQCELNVNGEPATLSGSVSLQDEGEGDVTEVEIFLNDIFMGNPDEEGAFIYDRRNPGEYVLKCTLDEFHDYQSDPFALEPGDNLQLEEIPLFPIVYGNISGTVTSVHDAEILIEDVEIFLRGLDDIEFLLTMETDENGEYFNEERIPVGNYSVFAFKVGWGRSVEEEIEINADGLEMNFELDDQKSVRALRADGNYDDQIELFWLSPGSGGEPERLAYHDGQYTNGMYLLNHEDIIATRFEPEGEYDILELIGYFLRDHDLGVGVRWPDGGRDDIIYHIFDEDPETGLPNEELFSRELTNQMRNFIPGWDTLSIQQDLRFMTGAFYFGWSQDVTRGEDAVGLDAVYDNEGTSYIRFDNEWRPYDDMIGDQIVEVIIWSHENEEEQVIGNHNRQPRRTPNEFSRELIIQNIQTTSLEQNYVLPSTPYNWEYAYNHDKAPLRDPAEGFMVYVDSGEGAQPALEEPLPEDARDWVHIIGSENENVEYTYSINALYQDGEIELEGVEVTSFANMTPGSVTNVTVESEGNQFTISWLSPQENVDFSDCVDYNGCLIFRGEEQVADIDSESNEWTGEIGVDEEGWYDFRLIAYDEVPNLSAPVEITVPLGNAIVYDFEINDPSFIIEPRDTWMRTQRLNDGPGDAHSGSRAWGTKPLDGEYEDNCDWQMIMADEYYVDSPNAKMEFYHFLDSETGKDGGQVLISTDDGINWELITPENGYLDMTVAGLMNSPGYTGVISDWTLTTFNLGEYENQLVKFKWRFGSDQSIHNYSGWYLDDLVLWGCRIPEYGTAQGFVRDQDGDNIFRAIISDGRRTVYSGFNGFYSLQNLLPGEITISAGKVGFKPIEIVTEVEEDDALEIDITLIEPRLSSEPEELVFDLGGNDHLESELILTNLTEEELPFWIRVESSSGGLLRANSQQSHISEMNKSPQRDDPWDVVFDMNLNEITGTSHFMGAEFDGEEFYLTSYNPVGNPRVIKLSWEGVVSGAYNQPVDPVGWGLRDLAWDGELLYGSQNRTLYGFDSRCELIREQAGAPITLNRALAYDSNEGAFWCGEWDSPIFLINREGEIQVQWDDHGLNGIYGLAFHPNDPDDQNLYIINREDDGSAGIYKSNPAEGEIEHLFELEGEPTGMFITGAWDEDRWILGAIVGWEEQHLIGLELDDRITWLSVEPQTGELAPGDEQLFTVNIEVPINAQEDDEYSGEITVRMFNSTVMTIPLEVNIIEDFRHFDEPEVSNEFHTIVIESAIFGRDPFPVSSEVATITPRGDVGGLLRWVMAPAEIRAYRSETGFEADEAMEFSIWIPETNREYDPDIELVAGSLNFQSGSESTINLWVAVPDTQRVALASGWNLSSINVQPEDNEVADILSDMNERDNLVIVKDGFGRFWWPAQNYNGLREWNILGGYQINVVEADEIVIIGDRFDVATPIELNQGWNVIGYLPNIPVDSRIALAGIIDNVIIAKDGSGRFMVPEYGYYGLGIMHPGKGYKIKVTENLELIYNMEQEDGDELALGEADIPNSTGNDMSILLTANDNLMIHGTFNIVIKSEAGKIVTNESFSSFPYGIILRGDDEMTAEIDGLIENELFGIELTNTFVSNRFGAEFIDGRGVYESDGFAIIELSREEKQLPMNLELENIYPNPFNSKTTLKFGVPKSQTVLITLKDINGRSISKISEKVFNAGWHELTLDGLHLASGIYFVEISSVSHIDRQKLVLLR